MPEVTEPRVKLPKVEGRDRHAPDVLAHTQAVGVLALDVHARLDRAGAPREIEAGTLTLLGRVDALLDSLGFESSGGEPTPDAFDGGGGEYGGGSM